LNSEEDSGDDAESSLIGEDAVTKKVPHSMVPNHKVPVKRSLIMTQQQIPKMSGMSDLKDEMKKLENMKSLLP
jgi:hypothetical protein